MSADISLKSKPAVGFVGEMGLHLTAPKVSNPSTLVQPSSAVSVKVSLFETFIKVGGTE